eukprot:3495255-Pleurochrysis_carterae.AAC.7
MSFLSITQLNSDLLHDPFGSWKCIGPLVCDDLQDHNRFSSRIHITTNVDDCVYMQHLPEDLAGASLAIALQETIAYNFVVGREFQDGMQDRPYIIIGKPEKRVAD